MSVPHCAAKSTPNHLHRNAIRRWAEDLDPATRAHYLEILTEVTAAAVARTGEDALRRTLRAFDRTATGVDLCSIGCTCALCVPRAGAVRVPRALTPTPSRIDHTPWNERVEDFLAEDVATDTRDLEAEVTEV